MEWLADLKRVGVNMGPNSPRPKFARQARPRHVPLAPPPSRPPHVPLAPPSRSPREARSSPAPQRRGGSLAQQSVQARACAAGPPHTLQPAHPARHPWAGLGAPARPVTEPLLSA